MTTSNEVNTITKRGLAKRLREAANRIDRFGLHKYSLGAKGVGYCAIGAIVPEEERTEEVDTYKLPVVEAAAKALVANGNIAPPVGNLNYSTRLYTWSDNMLRKKEDVVRTFRTVARKLEHGLQVNLNG